MSVAKIKLYRPSNGSEGDWFMEAWCERCAKDDYMNGTVNDFDKAVKVCQIIANSMAYDVTDPKYPREWREGKSGPECTAFVRLVEPERRGSSVAVRDDQTADLFPADNVRPLAR